MSPTIGRIVWYRTDGRNGLEYDLPAIIICTKDTHPGDYPDGRPNPLPVPESDLHVHLTVFSPGGYGSFVPKDSNVRPSGQIRKHDSSEFIGAASFIPGSGSYVEWNVPFYEWNTEVPDRSWRWPIINKEN